MSTTKTSGAATADAPSQEQTWKRFKELGAKRDFAELERLFASGSAPKGLDGPTDGILVAPMIQGGLDRVLTLITGGWMPWLGKSFDAANGRGTNLLADSARWPARALWPRYETRPKGGSLEAFDFQTRVAPGAIEPSVDVLKIDYGPVSENPGLIIRSILDELVEIVPDTYLGRILWRQEANRFANIGYFALKQSPTA
jgi:hypothetical protein